MYGFPCVSFVLTKFYNRELFGFRISGEIIRLEFYRCINSETRILHESGIFPGSYREGSFALQTLVVDLELVLLKA